MTSPENDPPQSNRSVGGDSLVVTSKLFSITAKGQAAVQSSRWPTLILAIGTVTVKAAVMGMFAWAAYSGGPELLKLAGPMLVKVLGH